MGKLQEDKLNVYIQHGYGGAIKIEAIVDDVRYVIEKEYLVGLLEEMIMEKGFSHYQKPHQKIPRLQINK